MSIYENSTYFFSDGNGDEFWPFAVMGKQGHLGLTNKNNMHLTYFNKAGTTDSAFFYPIRVNVETLELAGLCFEGCIYRFKKIK